ncbi:MAG: hypothetical protein E7672_06275 [Ruminococcaceae bacterium]|nr:hypothetical protein [Oscillospiraceae bacterium]
MFGRTLYDILFFGIPAVLLVLFCVGLYRYKNGKELNRQTPGTVSESEMKNRKVFLIVMSIIAGAILVVAVGFISLLFMAVAFM